MIFNESDMQYDYSWTTYGDDDPKITGEPDSTLLSRKEGYEVLYFVNKLLNCFNLKSLASAKKIEKLIHDKLPSKIRSQKNIKDWIRDNW